MAQLFKLEDFSAPAEPPAPAISDEEIEAIRREAFEEGFQAGAADAVAANAADQTQMRGDIAATVQELGFTYQEAVAHVMSGVEPVLRALVDEILPTMMAETVAHSILQELMPLAEAAGDIPVRLLVAEADATALRHVLGQSTPVPLAIVEDASLVSGQAHLRLGSTERQIDVAAVLERLSTAVSAVADLNGRKLANG